MMGTWNDHADGWGENLDVKFCTDRAYASLVLMTDVRGSIWISKQMLDFGCGIGCSPRAALSELLNSLKT